MNDNLIIGASKVAQYGGAGSAFIFGMSLEQFAALTGLLIALLGYFTNVYFQWRKDRREERFLQHNGKAAKVELDSETAKL